jgi:serine/threonine-protein kinase
MSVPDDTQAAGVRPGEILAGKYRVERLLGVGGMGVVVCAHHLQLDERVALKFLHPQAMTNPEAVARFDREARAAVKIKSEHVARVTDVGRLENGAPYMVMEYLEGRDLAALLQERGALAVEQAVEFVLQACEAIADAHALGIVHRDLKPANLFCIVRSDGMMSIKVLDFGISKLTGMSASRPEMSMTRTQALMGSPLYMSPEQLRASKGVDARTDIWALGIILFELVSGRVPFLGEAIPDLVLNIVTTATPSLRALRPDAPVLLEQVIQRCLEKERDGRFANVAELAQALAPLAPKRALPSVEKISRIVQNAGLATSVPRPPQGTVPNTAGAVGTMASWGQTAPGSGRKATTLVLGVLGAVVAIASVVAIVVGVRTFVHHAPPTSAAPPAVSAPAVALPPASPPAAAVAKLPEPDVAPSAAAAPSAAPPVAPLPTPSVPPVVRPAGGGGKPAGGSKPTCSAVPYLDNEGNMHFKQVCK